ncbi:MAG TPA: hypothetical protein PKD91_12710 [Bacteroidia bacterium]|nr:hypothetical protein [Bacteroidia bacterium]
MKDYGRNYFSATISDVFFGFATIGYERILKTGKFGIKLPLSIGFNEPHISSFNGSSPYQYHYYDGWDQTGYYSTNKIFSTGLDLYYYTGGQGTLRYFIGPCIEFGQFYYKYYETTNTQPVSYTVKKEIGSYGALIFKNGMLFQPTKSFNVSLTIGAGFYQEQTKYDNSNVNSFYDIEDLFAVEFGLHIGYKF